MKKNLFNLLVILVFIFLTACTKPDPKLYEIEQRGKLIVGTSPPYGIMEFYENGKIVGFDIDLAKEIAKYLNVEFEVKEIDFDKFPEALENNEIDLMIASITINLDRNSKMEFSVPYFNGGQSLVAKNKYNSYDDLIGKKILIEDDGTDNKKKVFEVISNFTPVFYAESEGMPYYDKALEEIKQENIDAFVIDYVAALDAVNENPNLKILGTFTDEYYGVAAKKGNIALIEKVNSVIRNLKQNGKLEKMKQKWIKN